MNIIAISNHIGAASSSVEKAFIMEVDTTIAGDLPDNQFLLRTHGNDVSQGNNFNVKTSDGQEFNNITAPTLTITFPSPGVYTLKISGKFSGTRYDYVTEGNKIIDILNWGDWEELQWARAGQSFRDCRSLTTFSAKDAPYLGGLDSQGIVNMFYNCTNLNADFSKWDVSPVSNFGGLFTRCSNFNNDSICNWDMSNATTLAYIFQYASSFNQDLSAWNTANVVIMSGIFNRATVFNGDVSTWNTSSLAGSLYAAFNNCAFNGDLSGWDTSRVTSMQNLFQSSPFNNNSIVNWDTSLVQEMRYMFYQNQFNHDISGWNTSSLRNTSWMFGFNGQFNQPIGVWDTSSLLDAGGMFYRSYAFNQDLSNWDVSNVTSMSQMFLENFAYVKDQLNIDNWTTTSLQNISGIFQQASGITSSLANWDMSNVTIASSLVGGGVFNFDVSGWNINGAVNLLSAFKSTGTPQSVINQWNFKNWDISQATNLTDFINNRALTTNNYDQTLISWAAQAPVNALSVNFGSSQYTLGSAAETARTSLIDTYGWTIIDGGGISILNNLVSYFKMDDDMIDTIDGQAPTINVGSTYEAGVVLDAKSFNGAEYAIYSGNEKYNMSDGTSDVPFSVSFWLKIDDATNFQARILNVAQSNQGWQYRIMCWGTDISLNLFSQSDLSASHYKTVTLTAGSYGGYHHYVFTYDGSLSQGMKAYRDGTLISSSAIVSGAYTGMRDITPDYCFGRRTNISAGYLKGNLDEFGVFKNKVLELSHVQELYNKGLNGVPLNEVYVPLTTNLVASYNFDADFADYTGNNPLTPSGSTPPVAGVAGGVVSDCAEFNSTGDYTLAADSDDFSFTDGVTDLPFSVSFWANFTGYNSGASGGAWLLSKRDTSTNEEYQILFYQNQFQVTLFSGGGNANKLNAGLAYPPPIGSWHHYTVTYDGNATFTGIKLYIDGVSQTLTDSSAGTYIGMANGSQAVNIGSTSWSPSQGSFDGKLDEYHIWKNRELTEAEVTDIYTTELAGNSILP